jgi:DNA repair exonuclease SbcCD ATPase subunit
MPPKNYSNITTRIDVREELDKLRKELNLKDLSDLLVLLVRTYREYTSNTSKANELLTSISSKLDMLLTSNTSKSPQAWVSNDVFRKFEDLINAYTSKIDLIMTRLSEVIERLDSLESRLKVVESTPPTKASPTERVVGKSSTTTESKPKKDLCEVLESEKVIYESSVAGKIKNLDAYFSKVAEECGAEVLEVKDQRVAVEPNFWNEFKEKLTTLNTNDESAIKKVLGTKGHKLLKTLWEGGLIYYDSVNSKWEWV